MTTVYILSSSVMFWETNDEHGIPKAFLSAQAAKDAGVETIRNLMAENEGLDSDITAEELVKMWNDPKREADNWDNMPFYIDFTLGNGGEASVCVYKQDCFDYDPWIVRAYHVEADRDGELMWIMDIEHTTPLHNTLVPLDEAEAAYLLLSLAANPTHAILHSQINDIHCRYIQYRTGIWQRLVVMQRASYKAQLPPVRKGE